MKRYKVIQWATGVVAKNALKGIIRHPQLELVGLRCTAMEKRCKILPAGGLGVSPSFESLPRLGDIGG